MKIAFIFGPFGQGKEVFDTTKLFTEHGLAGSRSSFWNAARGLSELGHEVTVFARVAQEASYYGVTVKQRPDIPTCVGSDVVVSWMEPDMLRGVRGALRVCAQQLNDFVYCRPGFDDFVDLYVCPSDNHLSYMAHELEYKPPDGFRVDPARAVAIGNSVNLEMFEFDKPVERSPNRVVYCSSPDRGLHQLLPMWPDVRRRMPDATLHVYYGVMRWANSCSHENGDHGFRARFVVECLRRLGIKGENGVTLLDQRPNIELYRALSSASVLAYPCDPIRYTEGFGVAILDALAAGTKPIISDVDALPSVFGDAARVIKGNPAEHRQEWVNAIVNSLETRVGAQSQDSCREFAKRFSRQNVAKQWEVVLAERLSGRVAA